MWRGNFHKDGQESSLGTTTIIQVPLAKDEMVRGGEI